MLPLLWYNAQIINAMVSGTFQKEYKIWKSDRISDFTLVIYYSGRRFSSACPVKEARYPA